MYVGDLILAGRIAEDILKMLQDALAKGGLSTNPEKLQHPRPDTFLR